MHCSDLPYHGLKNEGSKLTIMPPILLMHCNDSTAVLCQSTMYPDLTLTMPCDYSTNSYSWNWWRIGGSEDSTEPSFWEEPSTIYNNYSQVNFIPGCFGLPLEKWMLQGLRLPARVPLTYRWWPKERHYYHQLHMHCYFIQHESTGLIECDWIANLHTT